MNVTTIRNVGLVTAGAVGAGALLWYLNRTPEEPTWPQRSAFPDDLHARPTADVARDMVADFERFPDGHPGFKDGIVDSDEYVRGVPIHGEGRLGTTKVEKSALWDTWETVDVYVYERLNRYDGAELWSAIRDASSAPDFLTAEDVEDFLKARSTDGDPATMSVAEQRALLADYPTAYRSPVEMDGLLKVRVD